MASAGDIPTQEALAATDAAQGISRPQDPFHQRRGSFQAPTISEHPHGLSDRDFDSLVHSRQARHIQLPRLSALIHRLAYRRTNHDNIHVRGYKEKGNINTPLELAINNNIDRFSLAMDVVDRVPRFRKSEVMPRRDSLTMQIECRNYAHEHGIDKPEASDWTWPY